MPSFQISLTPSRRAAGRFIAAVRRNLQRAFSDQEKAGLSQSEIARRIGVHRSVINRELRGAKDITLGRVAELAWAMGRRISFDLIPLTAPQGYTLAESWQFVGDAFAADDDHPNTNVGSSDNVVTLKMQIAA